MRAIIALIAVLFYLFYFPFVDFVFAARSLTISVNKDSLFGDEEVILTASASGFTNGETIYIKGAFYQEGSTNYFGYTKNGDNWIKNGDSTLNQKSIQIGQWDGSILAKSDFADSGYKGEGGYKFKIGFYYLTSGGNLSSVNWSANNLDINLNEPDPTPTNTPTPTQIPTPTSTPTSTPTPTPTRVPIPTLTPKLSVSPTSTETLSTEILGESTESGGIALPMDTQSSNEDTLISNKPNNTNSNWFRKILIFVGIVFIVSCGILTFREIKKKKLMQNE